MSPHSAAVDWTRGKVQLRHVKGRTRREIMYPTTCPNCGRERWLNRSAALKAIHPPLCQPCARTLPGRSRWFSAHFH